MKKIFLIIFVAIIAVGGYIGYPYYQAWSLSELTVNAKELPNKFTVPVGTTIGAFGDVLQAEGVIENGADFNTLAKFKNYDTVVIKGSVIKVEKAKWTNLKGILNNVYLQSQNYNPTADMQFNNAKSIADIAGKLARNIELDSSELADYLLDPLRSSELGFNENTYRTFFIPLKIEVYKSINEEEVLEKLKKFYKDFWSADRKLKAANIGYSQSQITIIASIVYEEQKVKFDEQPSIAGLYINRLKAGWKLQADPTVKYAIGDPTIKRLLYKHLEVESPYNTYQHLGLPPGPISFPEPQTIDAVLNYKNHEFMFMCAKPEYTGYHNFSKTLTQHNAYAKKYQKWLNSEGIR